MEELNVENFYNDVNHFVNLKLINKNDADLKKIIATEKVFSTGLALTGFTENFVPSSVQILGKQELNFISQLAKEDKLFYLERLLEFDIPCFLVSDSGRLNLKAKKLISSKNIPIFRTKMELSQLIKNVLKYMELQFAPKTVVHGTLVDVHGTGILLMGRSGIGKSEVALDLVERGHRFISDDYVIIKKTAENVLVGKGRKGFCGFMEIRGVGIINIKEIFGTKAIRMQKRIEIIINLEEWDKAKLKDVERTGFKKEDDKILGVSIPMVRLPIYPGKNITVICEVIALNLQLEVYGYHASKELNKKLINEMNEKKRRRSDRLTNYLTFDYE
ncbi:MAG: HPr(Ser) kinase/phosphatase [Candidatus Cloacimonadota bacterium]|nr:MAG: HPr(Ser) kinase/phosphatase [Candidatus Cloacimonadota bacterium]PIE78753.1 MAG: HPr(Ser) kinase/phosphatase [Candidatus Delongbacteria bacterium]